MLKHSLKLIGTIAFFAVLWPLQGYSFDPKPEDFTAVVPSDMWEQAYQINSVKTFGSRKMSILNRILVRI